MEVIEGSSPPSPPSKRLKAPLTSSSSSSSVCIVCSNVVSWEYFVYITVLGGDGTSVSDDADLTDEFDPDEFDPDPGVILHPSFRLKGESSVDAFCVLNSQLYWFDGCDFKDIDADSKRSVHKLDLSKVTRQGRADGDLVLEKSGMDLKLLEMNHSKHIPAAIASLDGKKILVFSCSPRRLEYAGGFSNFDLANIAGLSDFELELELVFDFEMYDVDRGSWTSLPPLPASSHADAIMSYGFKTNSIFLVSRGACDIIFYLDISKGEKWECHGENMGIKGSDGPFCVINESLFITPHSIGVLSSDDVTHGAQLPFLDGLGLSDRFFHAMVLGNDKGEKEYTFCNFSLGRFVYGSRGRYPMAMNVFKFDVDILTQTILNSVKPTAIGKFAGVLPLLKSHKYTLIAEPLGILYFAAAACL